MQKILIFGLIAMVILSMSSSGMVDAFVFWHPCLTDNCCKLWQKCNNYFCENVKCDPECLDDLQCYPTNHKAECKCQPGTKLKTNSLTHCEQDKNCQPSIFGGFICSNDNKTFTYTREWQIFW